MGRTILLSLLSTRIPEVVGGMALKGYTYKEVLARGRSDEDPPMLSSQVTSNRRKKSMAERVVAYLGGSQGIPFTRSETGIFERKNP